MSKTTIVLNSHSLSNFQICEAKYLYNGVINLEPLKKKQKMEIGTTIATWLELYYKNKIKPKVSRTKALANPLLWINRFEKDCECNKDDAYRYYLACIKYQHVYQNETWQPISLECGFSKVLYEDEKVLYVYEGRPDFHGLNLNGNYRLAADHKVQFSEYDIYEYNNQAFGYLWALECKEFVYNYIKILKKDWAFRRQPFSYDLKLIEDWKNGTIEWYSRVAHAIQQKSFVKSWQCTSVYGRCEFSTICERTIPSQKLFVIQANYRVKKPYRSW